MVTWVIEISDFDYKAVFDHQDHLEAVAMGVGVAKALATSQLEARGIWEKLFCVASRSMEHR